MVTLANFYSCLLRANFVMVQGLLQAFTSLSAVGRQLSLCLPLFCLPSGIQWRGMWCHPVCLMGPIHLQHLLVTMVSTLSRLAWASSWDNARLKATQQFSGLPCVDCWAFRAPRKNNILVWWPCCSKGTSTHCSAFWRPKRTRSVDLCLKWPNTY